MNMIVFVLRGCPAGWLGAYGNEWVATPNLDRLAAESVVFDAHISRCPTAEAANRAWLPDGPPAGVRTVLVRANHPETDQPAEFEAGWSEVIDARPREEDASPLEGLLRQWSGIVDRIAAEPHFLLWVEIDRLLPPWSVPQDVFEAYISDDDEEAASVEPLADPEPGVFDRSDVVAWQWLHSSFAAVVTALDAELGGLWEKLRERGLDQKAAWVVTSDFGLPLGEHARIGPDGSDLHEELIHLPLIVRRPNAEDAGSRISGLTQPASLASGLPSTAVQEQARSEFEGGSAIRTAEWAVIVPADAERKPMLFTKPDDRWEVHDVASQHEETLQALLSR